MNEGKPKIGRNSDGLIKDIENFLGYNNTKDAVLAGVGKLGQALMKYQGFEKYGLNIIAGFDIDETIENHSVDGDQREESPSNRQTGERGEKHGHKNGRIDHAAGRDASDGGHARAGWDTGYMEFHAGSSKNAW